MSNEYPECSKWKEAAPQRQTITEFLEWLREQNISLCTFRSGIWEGEYFPIMTKDDQLLYDFLGMHR